MHSFPPEQTKMTKMMILMKIMYDDNNDDDDGDAFEMRYIWGY